MSVGSNKDDYRCSAVILARGGSKGIPRKNVLDFCGHPLVSWSIMQAKQSKNVDRVFLSSDDQEIIEIGRTYGAEIIKRPPEFATDEATSESAMIHALSVFDEIPDALLMLEPTAPLRRLKDIDNAISMFFEKGWDSCFSGAALEDFLIWKYGENGELQSINYDYKKQGPRQMRQPDFVENGGIYLFKPDVLQKQKNRFGGLIGIYPNDFWQSFEIDAPSDWSFVELIFKQYLLDDYKKNYAGV